MGNSTYPTIVNVDGTELIALESKGTGKLYTTIGNISTGVNASSVGTAASVASLTVSSAVSAIRTTGYAAYGDGGDGLYKRVAVQPAHAGRIQSADGTWWELTHNGRVSILQFGADKTGAVDSYTAINNAITYARTFLNIPALYIPAGTFLVSATLVIPGFMTVVGEGRGVSWLKPTITNGTACIQIASNANWWELNGFAIAALTSSPTFITGTTAQNVIGIQSSGTTPRFRMSDLHIYGCATGLDLHGWVGTIDNVLIDYCELGMTGNELNAVTANIQFEACRKYFTIINSSGLHLNNLLGEGDVANTTTSTIDACNGVFISAPYFEAVGTYPRTQPYVTVGATTNCNNIYISGCHIDAGAAFATGVYPFAFDKVTYGEFTGDIAEGNQRRLVSTTANTLNFRQSFGTHNISMTQDASATLSIGQNYMPTPNFITPLRGWRSAVQSGVAWVSETTIVRSSPTALRITPTPGQASTYLALQLPLAAVTLLRGQTIRIGAWVWVPNLAAYSEATRTAYPDIFLRSSNGTVNVDSGSVLNSSVNNAWNYMYATVTVQADATLIQARLWTNNSVSVAVSEYLVFDSVSVVNAKFPLDRQMRGEYVDHHSIPQFLGGLMRIVDTAVPSDTQQVYAVGDQWWNSAVAAAGSPGSICTTGGAGGTAVWKAMAAVAA